MTSGQKRMLMYRLSRQNLRFSGRTPCSSTSSTIIPTRSLYFTYLQHWLLLVELFHFLSFTDSSTSILPFDLKQPQLTVMFQQDHSESFTIEREDRSSSQEEIGLWKLFQLILGRQQESSTMTLDYLPIAAFRHDFRS